MRRIVLVTEGSPEIALGHVYTVLSLAGECRRLGFEPLILAIGELARTVCKKHGVEVRPYQPEPEYLSNLLADAAPLVIVNVRQPESLDMSTWRSLGFKVLVMDEFGRGTIDADYVHNSTPIESWQRSSDGFVKTFNGLSYHIVQPEFRQYHQRQKWIRPGPKRLLVSMGGVDRTGATPVIARSLDLICPGKIERVLFVLGAGFLISKHANALTNALADCGYDHEIQHDINDMWVKLFEAEVLFSAGGNTLFEAACVGTPAIVLWEDPHEEQRGLAAEQAGFARCLGSGATMLPQDIAPRIEQVLDDYTWLGQASQMGKTLIDGQGANRLLSELATVTGIFAND